MPPACRTAPAASSTASPAKGQPLPELLQRPGFLDRKIDVYQGKLAYDLGGIKLTSITNYTKLTKSYLEDGDATPLDLIR
jgi:iron complex outermembrane receptor protein